MKSILRTLALSGVVAAAAVAGQAQAQAQVGFAVRVGSPTPVYYDTYVPACPGVGFVWTPGYYTGRVWVAGRWIHRDNFAYARHYDRFDHRGWDHGRRYR